MQLHIYHLYRDRNDVTRVPFHSDNIAVAHNIIISFVQREQFSYTCIICTARTMQLHVYHVYSESNTVTRVSFIQREQCSYTCIICIWRAMQLHMYYLHRESNTVARVSFV